VAYKITARFVYKLSYCDDEELKIDFSIVLVSTDTMRSASLSLEHRRIPTWNTENYSKTVADRDWY
jgi:hypothetical protein